MVRHLNKRGKRAPRPKHLGLLTQTIKIVRFVTNSLMKVLLSLVNQLDVEVGQLLP
jgi:hypothetical protein